MRLKTSNGWFLTEEVSLQLRNSFEGSDSELVTYALSNDLGRDLLTEIDKNGEKLLAIRPVFYIGNYQVFPGSDGIIATEK